MLAPWKKSYGKPRQHIKKQRHYFADKGLSSQSYGFSSSHWALESITTNKASRGDGIPVELFQILKDDAVKVLKLNIQKKKKRWWHIVSSLHGY